MKLKADVAVNLTNSNTVAPSITSCKKAHAKVDRLNLISHVVIGSKEGVADGITTDATNAVLRTSNSSNHTGVEKYTLAELVAAAITGANRLAMNDVIDQLQDVLGMTFNFSKNKL